MMAPLVDRVAGHPVDGHLKVVPYPHSHPTLTRHTLEARCKRLGGDREFLSHRGGVLTVVAALDHKLVSSHPRQQWPVFHQHDVYAGLVEREAVAGMTGVLEGRPGP